MPLQVSWLCPAVCSQSFVSGWLIARWKEVSQSRGEQGRGSPGTCKHAPHEFLRCEAKDGGSLNNHHPEWENGPHISQARWLR